MRRIHAGLFMSLDGVVEAPEQWSFAYASPDVDQAIQGAMAQGDTFLLGRRTYEGFAGHWPDQTGPIADVMNNTPKLVVSTTLDTVEWQNSTLIKGDVAEELRRIKQQPGKNLNMTGSPTLVAWLLGEGLLDELQLIVCPLVLGGGQRLFPAEDGGRVPLQLKEAKTYPKGVIDLTYTPERT